MICVLSWSKSGLAASINAYPIPQLGHLPSIAQTGYFGDVHITVLSGAGSFRPVCEGQSLVLLGDGSVLSGLAVINSGGNGVSNQPGARVFITRNDDTWSWPAWGAHFRTP